MIPWLRISGRTMRLLACLAIVSLASACGGSTGDAHRGPGAYKIGKPYRVAGLWYYPRVDYAYHEKGLASWYGPNFHGRPTANGEIFDMHKVSAAHKTLPLPSVVRVTNLENGRTLDVRVNDRGPFIRGRIIDLSRKAADLLGFLDQGTALVDVQLIVEPSRKAAVAMGAANHPQFGPAPPQAAPSIEVTIENLDAADVADRGTQGQAAVEKPSPRTASSVPSPDGTPPPYDGMTNVGNRTRQMDTGGTDDPLPPDLGELVGLVPVGSAPPIFIQAGAFSRFENANRLRARIGLLGYPVRVHQVYIENQPMFRVRVGPLRSIEAADQTLDRLVAAGYPDAQIVID